MPSISAFQHSSMHCKPHCSQPNFCRGKGEICDRRMARFQHKHTVRPGTISSKSIFAYPVLPDLRILPKKKHFWSIKWLDHIIAEAAKLTGHTASQRSRWRWHHLTFHNVLDMGYCLHHFLP